MSITKCSSNPQSALPYRFSIESASVFSAKPYSCQCSPSLSSKAGFRFSRQSFSLAAYWLAWLILCNTISIAFFCLTGLVDSNEHSFRKYKTSRVTCGLFSVTHLCLMTKNFFPISYSQVFKLLFPRI